MGTLIIAILFFVLGVISSPWTYSFVSPWIDKIKDMFNKNEV